MVQDKEKYTKSLFILLGLLILVGIIMVYSSSYLYAKETFGSSTHFFIKQMIYAALGIALIFCLSKTKFSFWYKYDLAVNYFFTFLLLLTLVPGIGINLKGAYRWISFKNFYLQPGEFVKFSLLPLSITFFENFHYIDLKKRILYSISLILPLGILICQPDFGAFTICLFVIAFVGFLSSFPRKYFYSLIFLGLIAAMSLLVVAPYRVQRIMTFLDPWKDSKSSGFQIIQSYLAFANGAIFGKGIGNSNEKLFYLPEAHNDFIFSVIGEEFGFLGVILVVSLFIGFIYLGFKLAVRIENRVAAIFVASIIFAIGLQASLNMGVVLGLLPTKGLNLPFISYGGSSMIANCMAIGLVLSAWNANDKPLVKTWDNSKNNSSTAVSVGPVLDS